MFRIPIRIDGKKLRTLINKMLSVIRFYPIMNLNTLSIKTEKNTALHQLIIINIIRIKMGIKYLRKTSIFLVLIYRTILSDFKTFILISILYLFIFSDFIIIFCNLIKLN